MSLVSRYRVHLAGLACFVLLVRYWRAGELSDLSFWILGIDCLLNLSIWWFFSGQFELFDHDPNRERLAALEAKTHFLSDRKKGKAA